MLIDIYNANRRVGGQMRGVLKLIFKNNELTGWARNESC